MDFRVGSPVRRFREAAAVSDQDAATVPWRRLGPAQIQNTPLSGQLNPGTTKKQQQRQLQLQKPFLGSAAPRARKGFPQSSALRCAPFVQTKGLSTLATLRCKPWEIPLPLHLLPPLAWARAKA